jgi:hypothetical protein
MRSSAGYDDQEISGGSFWKQSTHGLNSTFTITLPVDVNVVDFVGHTQGRSRRCRPHHWSKISSISGGGLDGRGLGSSLKQHQPRYTDTDSLRPPGDRSLCQGGRLRKKIPRLPRKRAQPPLQPKKKLDEARSFDHRSKVLLLRARTPPDQEGEHVNFCWKEDHGLLLLVSSAV